MIEATRGRGGFAADAEAIWRAALAAVEPWNLVRESVERRGDVVRIKGREFDLAAHERVFVVSFGKAAAAMGEALAEVLDERLTSGLVVVPWPVGKEPSRLEYIEAAHPIPDARSVEAGRRVLEIASQAGEKDLLFVCISGGGSSLLALPADGITLEKKRRLTDDLLRAGATIQELNVVRKHLSGIKGGQLARAASPGHGGDPGHLRRRRRRPRDDRLRARRTGTPRPSPTPGPSSSAMGSGTRRRPWSGPASKTASAAGCEETLKEGDPVFVRVSTFIVGDNMTALRAAKHEAEKRGFEPIFLSSADGGEARRTAAGYAAFLAELACSASALPRPLCLLAGGELTVTVKGRGKGGRNTEFVLASLVDMEKAEVAGLDWLILSIGTDGIDGPTDAAGAWADPRTIKTARALALNAAEYLDDNDSYSFFKQTGNLIVTGPTGTNVMDLRVFLLRAA